MNSKSGIRIYEGPAAYKGVTAGFAPSKKMVTSRVSPKYVNYLRKERNLRGNYTMWNGNKFVGFAFVQRKPKEKEWDIQLIGTNAGKGYGTILIEHIKKKASRKVNRLTLNAVNDPALVAFYKKRGFVQKCNTMSNQEGCLGMFVNLKKPSVHAMGLRPRVRFGLEQARRTKEKRNKEPEQFRREKKLLLQEALTTRAVLRAMLEKKLGLLPHTNGGNSVAQ
jgi:hypothetical protein